MKYEKFEEWVIGKKVRHSYDGDIGTVGSRACIIGDCCELLVEFSEGEIWCYVDDLEFLEEKPSEEVSNHEDRQIDWQVGQVVWDVRNGRGMIHEVNYGEDYPVHVVFDLKDVYGDIITDTYTIDGRYVKTQKARSLFFSEPVITAELYPPKKPFVPTLKKGQMVVIKGKNCFENWCLRYVHLEQEDRIYTEEDSYFLKDDIAAIYCVGEELEL